MLTRLAQTTRPEDLPDGYLDLFLMGTIAAAFLIVIYVFVTMVYRRWTRRELEAIEKDKQARRQSRSPERIDAWSASAERYVDHDKLPDEPRYESEENPSDHDGARDDEEPPPPGWGAAQQDEPDEDPDPYGLFDDKPYRDSDDDEESEDDSEEGWDDDEDDDLEDGPR